MGKSKKSDEKAASQGEKVSLKGDDGQEGVKLEANVTLANGITIIVGSMIGSGIFISPTGILSQVGSVGLSLIVWLLCGVYSAIGAYCFAELGTLIVSSGADYTYIYEAFGPFFAFLRLWVECLVVRPCTIAIVALAFAKYVIEPLFPGCDQPSSIVTILAILCISLLTAVNAYSVKLSTKVQDIFTVAKLIALIMVIIIGVVMLAQGNVEYLSRPFEYSDYNPGKIALAFYSGLFAYQGWNYLNCVTEELKDPSKNLPRAIGISMTLVTAIYVLTNVAYFTIVSPHEVLASPAVAVTFTRGPLGVMWWIMPIFVAFSTFGTVNGILFTTARLFFVGGREGHMPQALSMIQVKQLTPAPAVIFVGLTSMCYLISKDMYKLMNYVGFVNWFAIAMAVVALLVFRKTRPNADRPVKVWLGWPIIYIVFSIFLTVLPIWASPVESGLGILVILSGVPVYFVCIVWKNKPKSFNNLIDNLTIAIQKTLIVASESKTS